ncbi:Gfo/Idh/MocA family oxidoreductase [Devosia sp. BSSL-BM10]|uniref:Gfo/Idh/MocA family oxidoreductase n=1 Tax=Devosia litorisediminis TaxID=2829817 RepID=A0A942ED03_9HYPH|nr:Gfo/Idh/MocA family oxidoreductase [Devosia litorisediminis]MBS3849675.1 Gfo/Idh/MocA family oxidoreductase [Devosia litorisediminis]
MSDEQGRFAIGVIGAGMGAKPHALALQSLSDTINVLGVYRRNRAELDSFCSTYGFPAAESYEALLADPRLDAVLVLTTPNAREEIVAAAAAAGKHVLLEKPVERSVAAAERIVAMCDAADVKLGVIFQHRFRRASRILAEAIAENRYGRLEAVHLVVPWWRPQEGYYDQPGRGTLAQDGGGVLITQAIHSLDLMLRLCGEVKAVTAMAATTRLHQMETEDFVSAGLEFDNGAVGAMMATTANFPGGPESLTLNFADASATLTAGNLTVQTRNGETITEGEASQGGGGADPMAFPFDWHAAQIADFADAVDHDRNPVSTGHTAMHVHRLIDALMRSSKEGKRVTV